MHSKLLNSIFLIAISIVLVVSSCKKDEVFDNNPGTKLSFSADTLIFDTIFSTIGSITGQLHVYNSSKNSVRISNIKLAGGENSRYSINVDGLAGNEFTDVEIPGKDSIYIFVRVTINPNEASLPFIVTDSIVFETNGNQQDIDLVAWGQNARFIRWNVDTLNIPKYRIVAGEGVDTTWTSDLPIVIYGYAVVDSTASLTINAGTKIYFHNASGLWIYKGGSLKVLGTMEEPVYFQGDRLDDYYRDLPGQWDRIWLNEGSINNEINYAVIRNGFIGIQAETMQEEMGNRLIIKNTIIENMTGAGILTRYYLIEGENCLIANCGQYALALTMGGNYDFKHTTIANYWNFGYRQTASVVLNNYAQDEQGQIYAYPLTANFANCIIYGNRDEEISLDENDGEQFVYKYENCLLKTALDMTNQEKYISCLKNEDPLFKDFEVLNFELDSLSPAKNVGSLQIATTVPLDLKGTLRTESPDLGAYEWIPVIVRR